MTNFIARFLGLHDKKQAQESEQVAQYVNRKKDKFTNDMLRVQQQAKRTHKTTLQAYEESVKLTEMVESVTNQVAQATPEGKDLYKKDGR